MCILNYQTTSKSMNTSMRLFFAMNSRLRKQNWYIFTHTSSVSARLYITISHTLYIPVGVVPPNPQYSFPLWFWQLGNKQRSMFVFRIWKKNFIHGKLMWFWTMVHLMLGKIGYMMLSCKVWSGHVQKMFSHILALS